MADNFRLDNDLPNPPQDVENPSAVQNKESNTNTNTATSGSSSPHHVGSSRPASKALKLSLVFLALAAVVAIGVALGLRNNSTDDTVATQTAAANLVVQESFVSEVTSDPDSPNPKKQKTKADAKSSRFFASGYETCADLENDITDALKLYIDKYIAYEAVSNEVYASCDPDNENWMNDYYYDYYYNSLTPNNATESLSKQTRNIPAHNPTTRAGSNTKNGKRGSRATGQQGDGFDQNVQHEGVAEKDKVVSDGTFVYAAYGDVLYAWTAADSTKGVSITQVTGDQVVECDWDTTEPCTTTYKPSIQALFLSNSRLTAIVTQSSWTNNLPETYTQPAFDTSTKTLIIVFDISDVTLGSPLNELGRKEINGSFTDGRSVGDKTIIATNPYINSFAITDEVSRYQPQYCGLDTASYTSLATETAVGKAEAFAKKMVAELESANGCDSILQMSTMQSSLEDAGLTLADSLSSFFQVYTFDMSSDFGVDGTIPSTVAGAFIAGYGYYYIYLADDFLAVPSTVYQYDYTTGKDTTDTFILGFDLSTGDSAVPYCYAHIPGRLDNNYRMDKWDGHLRITATTSETVNWTTKNTQKIYVLEIPSIGDGPGPMTLVGESENLADNNGYITGARFVGDKAYITANAWAEKETNEFVIVDLSVHSDPHVVGNLESDGYLSYMHQINIDGTPFILGIGSETEETDITIMTFMKLFLIDVSTPASPKLAASYRVADSLSAAAYDFIAVRFTADKKLIIPVSKYTSTDTSEGFAVYDITKDSITQAFEVTHSTTDSDLYCNNEASIPARSFVFQSELTTVQGNTIITTELESGKKISELDLDVDFGYNVCTDYSDYSYHYAYSYAAAEYSYEDDEVDEVFD